MSKCQSLNTLYISAAGCIEMESRRAQRTKHSDEIYRDLDLVTKRQTRVFNSFQINYVSQLNIPHFSQKALLSVYMQHPGTFTLGQEVQPRRLFPIWELFGFLSFSVFSVHGTLLFSVLSRLVTPEGKKTRQRRQNVELKAYKSPLVSLEFI